MIRNIKIILIMVVSLLVSSFSFAEGAEVHFLGKIVEPACDVLMQREIHCQPIFKQNELNEVTVETVSFVSKEQIGRFLNQYAQKSNARMSIELLNYNDTSHQNIGNLMVKYR